MTMNLHEQRKEIKRLEKLLDDENGNDANSHCSDSSGSLIRKRSTNLMLYSWGLGFGMTNLAWGILDGMPAWPLHLAGLGCVIAAVCVYASKGLLTGDVSIPSENT